MLDEKNTIVCRSVRHRGGPTRLVAGKATVPGGGVALGWIALVLPGDRWSKVLVRGQADAVEITAGMAKRSFFEDRSSRSSSNYIGARSNRRRRRF